VALLGVGCTLEQLQPHIYMCLPTLFSVKQLKRPKRPVLPVIRGKRTPRRLNGRYPHICSSVKIGVNVSRQKTQTLALVSCVVAVLVARVDDCHIGEVGKLLGAKWKELDDEEKKVSDVYAYSLHLH
jgi:hypothetical protein